MQAGKLRHRITLQRKTVQPDIFGGSVDTWTDTAVNVWASVEPLQGRELSIAQSVSAETTTRITMRYRADVLQADRIVFDGKFYNLQSVIDSEMLHQQLVIMASEGLNEG